MSPQSPAATSCSLFTPTTRHLPRRRRRTASRCRWRHSAAGATFRRRIPQWCMSRRGTPQRHRRRDGQPSTRLPSVRPARGPLAVTTQPFQPRPSRVLRPLSVGVGEVDGFGVDRGRLRQAILADQATSPLRCQAAFRRHRDQRSVSTSNWAASAQNSSGEATSSNPLRCASPGRLWLVVWWWWWCVLCSVVVVWGSVCVVVYARCSRASCCSSKPSRSSMSS